MARKKAVKGILELEAAERRVPLCKFVQSCRSHLKAKGFLSDRQIRALTFAGTPNRKARQFVPMIDDLNGLFDYEYEDWDDGFDPFG